MTLLQITDLWEACTHAAASALGMVGSNDEVKRLNRQRIRRALAKAERILNQTDNQNQDTP